MPLAFCKLAEHRLAKIPWNRAPGVDGMTVEQARKNLNWLLPPLLNQIPQSQYEKDCKMSKEARLPRRWGIRNFRRRTRNIFRCAKLECAVPHRPWCVKAFQKVDSILHANGIKSTVQAFLKSRCVNLFFRDAGYPYIKICLHSMEGRCHFHRALCKGPKPQPEGIFLKLFWLLGDRMHRGYRTPIVKCHTTDWMSPDKVEANMLSSAGKRGYHKQK